ncbi:hypothetical protein [Paenibacillus caseinilyticus]|nr:hypothetical protein [Paenibacillus caseinilyticus]MCZ8523432.1 hypothetical protein [Paenibacillus caseinilyticus]
MAPDTEYVLIVHTDRDIHIEEGLFQPVDIHRYVERHRMSPEWVEMITKQEFNDRLDRMLTEF